MLSGMSQPALSLIGVSKHFRAGVPGCSASVEALRAVDVQVEAGEILGVAGPTGAGKSTLLLCAAGLLRPDIGTVRWFGGETMPPAASSAMVFVAEPPLEHPPLDIRDRRVREVRDVYGALRRVTHEHQDRAATSLVPIVADCCAHRPRTQRPLPRRHLQAIAQAFAARPRLLLLDDPFGTADATARTAICVAIHALASAGAAVVVTSRHDHPLSAIATRRLRLVGGVVLADQRRNRSAARVRGSSRSARARSSMRSTNGRSFRSPQ